MCNQETFELGCTPDAATRARHLVRTRARAWMQAQGASDSEDAIDLLVLLTSELVGNACRHGADPVQVDLGLVGGVATIAVSDGAPGAPFVRAAGPWDESGRGMAIVDAVSEEWGVRSRRWGKQVWCRVRLAPEDACGCGQGPKADGISGTVASKTATRRRSRGGGEEHTRQPAHPKRHDEVSA